MFCPRCGRELPEDANFCPVCGYRFSAYKCPVCGEPVKPGTKFCAKCGTALEEPRPRPEREENYKRDRGNRSPRPQKRKGWKIGLIIALCMVLAVGGGIWWLVAGTDSNDSSINRSAYNTYLEYDEDFLDIEAMYLNDDGYVDSEDIDDLLDDIEAVAMQGFEDGTITYYSRQGLGNIYIEFASGIKYIFIPYQEHVLSVGDGGSILTLEPNENDFSVRYQSAISWIDAMYNNLPYGGVSSNAIQIKDTLPEKYTYNSLLEGPYGIVDTLTDLTLGGGLTNSNVTVDVVKQLGDFQIIIWEGHGAYNETVHSVLITGESFVGWEEFSKYKDEMDEGTIILTSFPQLGDSGITYSPVRYYCVTSKFIEQYVGDMDQSLIFLGTCYSLKDDVLAQAFLDKGASIVLGYTGEISMEYEMLSRSVFFDNLTQDNGNVSVYDTYQSTISTVGYDFVLENGTKLSYLAQDGIDRLYTLNGLIEQGTYTGTVVVASDSNTPVVGASVTIINEDGTVVAEQITDEDGNFGGRFDPGSYTFTVEADGYRTATLSMEVESGETAIETILLDTNAVESIYDMWIELLASGEYKDYIQEWSELDDYWLSGSDTYPTDYAILDIDGDGWEELILTREYLEGFCWHSVLTCDRSSSEITALSIYEPVDISGIVAQHWLNIAYSSEYHALVYAEARTSLMECYYGYMVIEDGELTLDFYLGYEAYSGSPIYFVITPDGTRREISEDEYGEYQNELEWIGFSSISSAASSLAYEVTTTDDGHAYDDGVIIKEATETTVGVKVYTCTDCGDTYYEAILPTGIGAGISTVSASAAQAAYEAILEEYIAACADDHTRDGYWEDYPNVPANSSVMTYYHIYSGIEYYYAYYDIDGNGQDELLIGSGNSEGTNVSIVGLYSFDGANTIMSVDNTALGDRAKLSIYENGAVVISGSSGASSGIYEFYSLLEDGYTLNLNDLYYYEYPEDGDVSYSDGTITLTQEGFDVVYAAYTGGSAEVSDFQWYKLTN